MVIDAVAIPSNEVFWVVARSQVSHDFIDRVLACVTVAQWARNYFYIQLFVVFICVFVGASATSACQVVGIQSSHVWSMSSAVIRDRFAYVKFIDDEGI